MATNENLPPNVIKELAKELKSLDESPPDWIKVTVNDDSFSTIFSDVDGPAGTPYENGVFRMKLVLSHEFPHSPPKGYFLTKIFHPNVATNGDICVNALKKDWNPSLGLRHVLIVIRCLLIEPFPESALNEQAGKMLLEDYEEYARHARLYTSIHARPKPKQKASTISESTTALNMAHAKQTVAMGGAAPTPSPLGPCMSAKGNCAQDPAETANQWTESAAVGASAAVQKKETVSKVQVDKKKMDARKKSLKRL